MKDKVLYLELEDDLSLTIEDSSYILKSEEVIIFLSL